MKIKFKGPVQGQPFKIRAGARAGGTNAWGVAPGGAPGTFPAALSVSACNGMQNVFDLAAMAAGADEVVPIATARGRISRLHGGSILLDLTREFRADSFSFEYEARAVGKSPIRGTATVTIDDTQWRFNKVANALTKTGLIDRRWSEGRYWLMPEVAGVPVFQLRSGAVRLYVSSSEGLSAAQIAARETAAGNARTEAQITTAWLLSTIAAGTAVKYGQDPAYPLNETVANAVVGALIQPGTSRASHQIFLRAGDIFTTFAVRPGNGAGLRFPVLYARYGAGPNPILQDFNLSWASAPGMAFVGIEFRYSQDTSLAWEIRTSHYLYARDLTFRGIEPIVQGVAVFSRGITILDCRQYDRFFINHKATDTIAAGTSVHDYVNGQTVDVSGRQIWSTGGHKVSGGYFDTVANLLIDGFYSDHAGWAEGYPYNEDPALPNQPPSIFSHGNYLQYTLGDTTVRRTIYSRPSFSGLQSRSGGTFDRILHLYTNAGQNLGSGPASEKGNAIGGRFGLLSSVMFYGAGQLATLTNTSHIQAGAIDNQGLKNGVERTLVVNSGPGNGWQAYGPTGVAVQVAYDLKHNQLGTLRTADFKTRAWVPARPEVAPDRNLGGLDAAAMAEATLEKWLDARLGVTGSTKADVFAYLRNHARPFDELASIWAFIGPAYGYAPNPRTTPGIVYSHPDPRGHTPGLRCDLDADWIDEAGRKTLPGDVAGDSVALLGQRKHWAFNPRHALSDLYMGGADLSVWGGSIPLTGQIHGPGRILADQVCNIDVGGGSAGAEALDIELSGEARLVNRGDWSGPADIFVRARAQAILATEGAVFRLKSGRALTIEGALAQAGWDGRAGADGELILEPGSILRIRAGARMSAGGLTQDPSAEINGVMRIEPEERAVYRGAVSGATARLLTNHFWNLSLSELYLGEITGTWQASEGIVGPGWAAWQPKGEVQVHTVTTAPTVTWGRLAKVTDGDGTGNVRAKLTLTGAILDMQTAPVGTYVVAVADVITGTFGSVLADAGRTATVDYSAPGSVSVTVV